MNEQSRPDLILAGWGHEATVLASSLAVSTLDTRLSYEFLDEHAEEASTFLQEWVPTLPPLHRLEAANWAVGQYVPAMVHLEHASALAATLLLGAQEAATRDVAESFRGTYVLVDGPDAELDSAIAEQLTARAETWTGSTSPGTPEPPRDLDIGVTFAWTTARK